MKKSKPTTPTVVHVNTMRVKKNAVRGKRGDPLEPVIMVRPKNGKGHAEYGDTVLVKHNGVVVASVVYRPTEPLKSGAVCWLETDCDVEVTTHGVGKVSAPAGLDPALAAFLHLLVEKHGPEVRRLLDATGK